MENLIMVFMAFAGIICLFAVMVTVLDMVREMRAKSKREHATKDDIEEVVSRLLRETGTSRPTSYAEQAPAPIVIHTPTPIVQQPAPAAVAEEAPKPEPAPAPEEPVAEEPAPAPVVEAVAEPVAEEAPETDAESDENLVTIRTGARETHEEKYSALPAEDKARYDRIAAYAAAIPDVKDKKKDSSEEFKVGNRRIVKMTIRRGVIMCELVLENSEFRTTVADADNSIAVKQAPTVIRVDSDASADLVIRSIDIIAADVEAEKQRKRDERNAKRRQNRKASADGTSDEAPVKEPVTVG